MARDETIEARLWRWAEAVKGGKDVHGYPVKCTLHPDWSPPSPGMTPTLKVAPASDVRQTHALVLQLSERMQATLSAHYIYRMSMAQAGEMLGCRPDTVKDRVEAAHRQLLVLASAQRGEFCNIH
jgi:DNA-directed RNA polymerase specialized sigma24 family protein